MSQPQDNGPPAGLTQALQDPPPPPDPQQQTLPCVVIAKLPDGTIRPILQGVSPLEAPTMVELGLKALRKDLGLA